MIELAIDLVKGAVTNWQVKKKENKADLQTKREAVNAVMDAVVSTKAYLHDVKIGVVSRNREIELAHKWQHASMTIREYDELLYMSGQLKALGYADPAEWRRAELVPTIIQLDYIIEKCTALLEQP